MIRALESVLEIDRTDALVLFWHTPHRERIGRLQSLISLDHDDKQSALRVEFDTLLKRVDAAYEIRNTVGHGVWFKGSAPNTIKSFQMRARSADVKFTGRGLPPIEFTPERLVAESRKIDRLAADFREFFKTNFGARFVYKES